MYSADLRACADAHHTIIESVHVNTSTTDELEFYALANSYVV